MITARELVFYIRAEDQASRVVKRVGKSFGSLANIKSLEAQVDKQRLRNLEAIDKAQLRIARNDVTLQRAQVQAERLNKIAARGGAIKGYTVAQTATLATAATANVANLVEQERLLGSSLDEVRRAGDAASASIDREINAAKIARVNNWAGAFSNVARAIRLIGVVAGASLVFAAHQAATFNTQLTLAATQDRPVGAGANATLAIQQKLQTVVLKQMQQFPATSAEMADSLYQIFSGSNVQNIGKAANLLKLFNKEAVAGQTDLATATDAGLTLLNNFVGAGKEFPTVEKALNEFQAAVRYARTDTTTFAKSLSNVISIAQVSGLKFTDVAYALAEVTRATGKAATSRDTTGLARLIETLGKADTVNGLKKIGVNALDANKNLRPLKDIITDIVAHADLRGVNALNFFKNITALGGGGKGNQQTIQARRFFAFLIKNMKDYNKVAADIKGDNNELGNSFNALSKSQQVRWQVVSNQMRVMAITIGTEAIPALVDFAKYLVKALHWFNSLSEGTKHTIATIAVFGSAAAILGGTLVIMAAGITRVVGSIRSLRLAALGSEAGAATPQIMLLVAALVALGYILVKHPHWIVSVTHAMGGFKGVLMALSILVAGFTMLKVITALELTGNEAAIAGGKVAGLRLKLLSLVGLTIPAIVVPILYSESSQLTTPSKRPGQPYIKTGGGIAGFFNKIYLGGEILADKHLKGMTSAQAKAQIIKDRGGSGFGMSVGYSQAPAKAIENMRIIGNSPLVTTAIFKQAWAAYQRGDYATVAKIAKALTYTTGRVPKNPGPKYGPVDPNKYGPTDPRQQRARDRAAKAATTAIQTTDSAYMKSLRNVGRLDLLYQKTPSLENLRKYQAAANKLNKQYSDQLYQTYTSDYLNRVEAADNKSLKTKASNAKKALSQAARDAKAYAKQVTDAMSGITDMYNTILQQNQSNFGALFSGPYISSPLEQARLGVNNQQVRPMDVLKDLESEASRYNKFNNQLKLLHKKGLPQTFIDELNALGPSAPGAPNFINALTKLPPAAFKKYQEVWNKSQNAIKANTVTQLDAQLATYKKFGSKVALAIIAGMKSQDAAIQAQLKATLERLFPAFASLEKKSKVPKTTSSKSGTTSTTVNHNDNSTNDHSTTVHNPIAEGIDTTLAKNAFRNRNKRS